MSDQEKELWQKIKDKPYCDPTKRMDFVLFFDVRDGNPNGDPDAGNLPRMDPETRQGIVTDVCIKRKIRDYLAILKDDKSKPICSIYIQSQAALNTLYFDAARKIAEQGPKDDDAKAVAAKAVAALLVELNAEKNADFRALITPPESKEGEQSEQGDPSHSTDEQSLQYFGDWLASIDVDGLEFDSECGSLSYLGEAKAVKDFKALFQQEELNYEPYKDKIGKLAELLAKAKRDKKGGAQERKARDAVKRKMCELYDDIRLFGAVLTAGTNAGQIRGPMQLTFGRSIDPILQMDAAITRCAITKASDWTKKQTEFGRKPWLSWAVYRQHGFYNPLLGEQTRVNRDDLARFWESLSCMFRNSDSASKGEMTMHDIVVFVHDHPRGNAPSHLLFDTVKCKSTKQKGESDENKKDGIITIKRDGFDNYYTIDVCRSSDDKIKVERPLRDLWT